jgi:hypothetical protein
MTRALLGSALVLAVGCLPSSSGSDPDPRLGTLLLQIDEVSANAGDGAVKFLNGLITADSKGGVHLVGTLKPSRVYGTTNVHFNQAQYWQMTRDGKVVVKPGPSYSATTATNSAMSLRLGLDDDLPVLVQTSGLALGKVLSFYGYDGTGWTEKALHFSQLPRGASMFEFNNDVSQLRVLGKGQYLVQLQDRLLRSTATGWAELPRPPKAQAIRLVNADSESVRVLWTEAEAGLVAGSYSRATWTLASDTVRPDPPSLTAIDEKFSVAGTPTSFVADVGGTTWRFANNAFHRVSVGAVHEKLLLTLHPTRALRDGGRMGVFLGKDTGPTSGLKPGVNALNCPSPPTPEVLDSQGKPQDPTPFPDTAEARRCSSRSVDIQAVPEPDLSGLILVTFDRTQDAVLRAYVKHVPFFVPADPFFDTTDAGVVGFPGDDGSTDGEGSKPPAIKGRLFAVGLKDPTIGVVLVAPVDTPSEVKRVPVSPDGAFHSEPLAAGLWRVSYAVPGYIDQTATVSVLGQGPTDVGDIVLEGTIPTRPAPWRVGERLLGFDLDRNLYQAGTGTIHRGVLANNTSALITDRAESTPEPIFDLDVNGGPIVGWREGTAIRFRLANGTTPAYTNASLATYRPVGTLAPLVASGTVDGLTPRDWRWQTDAVLVSQALELALYAPSTACQGMVAWFNEGGNLVARWSNTACTAAPTTLVTGTIPQPPLTVVPNTLGVFAYQGAQCGAKGGYVTPCPLFGIISGVSMKLSDAAVDLAGDVFLERIGSTGSLKRYNFSTQTADVLSGNLSLPASYLHDERPFYGLRAPNNFAVRTTTGFTFRSTSIGAQAIAANVVRSVALPAKVAFFSSPNGDCAQGGCALELLESTATAPVRTVLIASGANGQEQVSTQTAGNVIAVGQRSWEECPGGPCPYLLFWNPGGNAGLPVARGALIPYPPLSRFKPILMSVTNLDGGTATPSTL